MIDNPERAVAKSKKPKIAKVKPKKPTRPVKLRKLLARKPGATIAQIQKRKDNQTAYSMISGGKRWPLKPRQFLRLVIPGV